ncbi:hypothetical protein PAXINDRAFT_84136 [Paxillus involutus ATCC 200175]|uniref:DUF6699 domain-containing protein n=1 Tax=Paxillus involutus ATCC 200175 TaxID=664439 RepID=A0A0C9TMC2_PAXIN|nr:hypothetical protein PAXINDRAFT_84136 [Paxillus involutus ATCC 200175]
MRQNYDLDDISICGRGPDGPVIPDNDDFRNHDPFTPVFPPAGLRSPWERYAPDRQLFGTPRHHPYRLPPRRRRSQAHFPDGANPGILATPGPRPGWVQDHTPHNQGHFNLPPVAANSGGNFLGGGPWSPYHPPLPAWQPNQYSWAYPTGNLTWNPHPQPHPNVPPSQFWSPNALLGGGAPAVPYGQPDPWSTARLTGGYPLPGTMPQWSPGTWPPVAWPNDIPIRLSPHIVPNPINANLAQIDWNLTKNPTTAKRLTANHVTVGLGAIWDQAITHPEANKVLVMCDVGYLSTLWGPIVIDQTRKVTVQDLFNAIHEYFQISLTRPEFEYIKSLDRNNQHVLEDAFEQRVLHSDALPGWERRQGIRRVDCLGDRKHWWGVWMTQQAGSWWLNLGLINPAHRQPRR